MRRLAATALAVALLATAALAAPPMLPVDPNDHAWGVPTNPFYVTGSVSTPASTVTGSVSAATITNTSTQAVAAASRKLLAIDNESTTATIACSFGGTAAINTAGSFTISPGATRTWNSYPVPADAVNCISSAATSPATIEVN